MSTQNTNRRGVENMFNNIAPSYDLLNHLLSLGIDLRWRRKASKEVLKLKKHDYIADFATGTGDFAIELARKVRPQNIVALDFSEQMLSVASRKIEKRRLKNIITLRQENCEHTSLEDCSMEAITIGFGIRNFNSPENGLKEMLRVLKPGGSVVILEFSTPQKGLLARLVKWYYFHVIPFVGMLFTGNRGAYAYLPATIFEFPNGEKFCTLMHEAGFEEVSFKSFTFNLVNLYIGNKPL